MKSNKNRQELGIVAKKKDNFSKWYLEIVTKCDLIDYSDVSGCYVLRENAYEIWENIKNFIDRKIKKMGVRNAYFPIFIPKSNLCKEQQHIDDFAPEVAWVTETGNQVISDEKFETDEIGIVEKMAAKIKFLEEKISKGRLDEPLAIRPTSETSMYPHFAKWIRSHRDLPYKVNQWNNVVRWEFKKATPFIRSREFLWQEGHTCYSNEKDARSEVDQVLDLYERVYRELLAVPTIKGTKTEKEKFAGAEMTKTIETFISGSGKAIQAATSHYLGQNFSKMFNISFEKAVEQGKQRKEEFVYQNSWGFTTRSIGIMIMTHSDDKGLILPPNIAPCQVMIVPIYQKNKDDEMVDLYAKKIQDWLRKFEIRVSFDNRKGYRPGFKYNLCETNGIPLRIDIGNRDVENSTFDISRRDTLIKTKGVDFKDLQHLVNSLLLDIQNSLYAKAKKIYTITLLKL